MNFLSWASVILGIGSIASSLTDAGGVFTFLLAPPGIVVGLVSGVGLSKSGFRAYAPSLLGIMLCVVGFILLNLR